ncbi:hypothetical protein AGRA3207_005184 [Actinomadura graeca]|uniref:Ribosomal protein L7/L12 C-terminal domain-containing protein n=1 Tax=Actinomadura graeca TaxID=2750812 RepID=A0ABX8QYM8_9ACTN|nr:hypothetical protein [Actinomadura graeca]QXJ23950.1 hypothetical protein AGRA3207_005184 [Actinomadura graeca]
MSKKQTPVLNVLPETRAQALELVADGKLMRAAGLVRKATGADRQAAKEYVDGLRVEVLAGRVPPEVEERARALVAEGKTIAAAKHVVQATGLGLQDGKQYVDALRAGRVPGRDTGGGGGGGTLSDRVRAFVAAGDRPSAVALVQAETGMGPEEAERFVAALE